MAGILSDEDRLALRVADAKAGFRRWCAEALTLRQMLTITVSHLALIVSM